MNDHKHDLLSGILPATTNNSGSFPAPVDVRSKVGPRHPPLRKRLDRRPVLGIDKRLVPEPLGNGLLAERRAVHELGNSFSKRGLATRDLYGSAQRSNVVFLHDRRGYTTKVVSVNNHGCVQPTDRTCTVLTMAAPARKRVALPKKAEKEAIRDAEGRTLGDRIRIGMEAKSRMLGSSYAPKDLLREASALVGRGQNDPPIVTQQAISKIMKNKTSYSEATPAFAQVLGLNSLWLAYGIGPRSVADTIR